MTEKTIGRNSGNSGRVNVSGAELEKIGAELGDEVEVDVAETKDIAHALIDSTEREQATDELSLKERAMDAAPIGVTIADASQDDNPIIYANDGYEDLTGYAKERVIGDNCRFLQGEGTADEPVAAMREAINNEEPVTVELLNYRKDGTEFWNRVSIAPIRNDDGEVTHYVGFQEDVTERKQAEQEANVLLAQFEEFGNVLAHDLQKPLSKARGRVELARQTETWDELEKADDALTRLNSLLDEFAEVMREGEIVNEPVDIDFGDISESVAQSVLPESASFDVVGSPRITADRRAVRRLVENLFSNAVDHSEDDVTIRVGETSDGFYVADDGPGIPVDQRDEVFTPGYSTRDDGTGMGLTSVRQIVMAHGWDITITESQSGGARFEITTHRQSTQSVDTVNKLQV